MKKSKIKSEPVVIKAMSFGEMINDVIECGKINHEKYLKDGLCQHNDCTDINNPKACTEKANPKYVPQGIYSCDKHLKEYNDMIKELSKDSGFIGMSLRF